MTIKQTARGFQLIEFTDRYGAECSLQQSSAIGEDGDAIYKPGSSMVWLGCDHETKHSVTGEPCGARMHLAADGTNANWTS